MEKIKVVNLIQKEKEIEVEDLTIIQRYYIDIIENFKRKHYRIPSMREINFIIHGDKQTGSVSSMIKTLKKKGYDYSKLNYEEVEND